MMDREDLLDFVEALGRGAACNYLIGFWLWPKQSVTVILIGLAVTILVPIARALFETKAFRLKKYGPTTHAKDAKIM